MSFGQAIGMVVLSDVGQSYLPRPRDARNISTLENDLWQWAPAGIAIVLSVLAINFIGDGLREALDPRL